MFGSNINTTQELIKIKHLSLWFQKSSLDKSTGCSIPHNTGSQ
jgi:hypothetical protein